jgi:4-hydroxybenzoate polyprenyltransferase
VYTVEDLDGDRRAGLVTTAVYLGAGPSLHLFRLLMLLTVVVTLAPICTVRAGPLYLLALLVCTVLPIVLHILPLTRSAEPAAIRRACHAIKVVRLTSLLPLILLRMLL